MASKRHGFLLHADSGFWVCPRTGAVQRSNGSRAASLCGSDPYVRCFQRLGHSCKTWYVHRLVWEVVNGSIPDSWHIDHLDSNPRNNTISNLEIVEPAVNRSRQTARCVASFGTGSYNGKLSPSEVEEIRATASTVPTKIWSERLGVSPRCIRSVRSVRTYSHDAAGALPRVVDTNALGRT